MANTTMTSRERVEAAIDGEPVDRPPVSIWRHFPEQDQTADDLTRVTTEWQHRFDFDFVKFMPPGDYPTIDWGGVTAYVGAPSGTRTTTTYVVNDISDWHKLRRIDVGAGFNGMMLEALRKARLTIDARVPILQTIFSPLTIAQKLSRDNVIEHLRDQPETVHAALEVIAGVTEAMTKASYEAGADGIFFASQCADFDVMDESEYRAFGMRYDLRVIATAQMTSPDGFTMFHMHGTAPMFDLGVTYPVEILNWHDRRTAPNLADGQRQFRRAVAGGLNEATIARVEPHAAAGEATEAIATTGGSRVLVAPGCVVPVATPAETIDAVVEAVRTSRADHDTATG